MNTKFPITPEGYNMLCKELEFLKSIERPNIINAIAEARAHGDLSENTEYSAAKEKQSLIEAKISDLEHKSAHAQIIDYTTISHDNKVQFGALVSVIESDSMIETKYRIVGEYEANLAQKMISITSPLARALLGKTINDEVEVLTPRGMKYYKIIGITY